MTPPPRSGPAPADRGSHRCIDRRAAGQHAGRSVRPRLSRGDRWEPVARRRVARRGGGSRPRARRRSPPVISARIVPAASPTRCCSAWQAAGRAATALARALSVLGDGAQVGDAGQLAGLAGAELEAAMAALVSAGVVDSSGDGSFHPPDPADGDPRRPFACRAERLHRAAAAILRGARMRRWAGSQRSSCIPSAAADPGVVALLRDAAGDALALGDAAGAAALLVPRPRGASRSTRTVPRSCSSSVRRAPAPAHRTRSSR